MEKALFSQRNGVFVFLALPTVVHSLGGGCDTAVDYVEIGARSCSGARVLIHGVVHRARVRPYARVFGLEHSA